MTNAAVLEAPNTSADTGADSQATAGEGDTGASKEVQTPAVQTDAKTENEDAAPSSPDAAKADAEVTETPEARIAREQHEAEVEIKAQELVAKQKAEADAKAAVEAKAQKADERKTKRATVKGAHTRALTQATNALAEAGLEDAVIDKALAPFKTHHLQFSGLLDGEYEAAVDEVTQNLHGVLRDLLPESDKTGFDDAVKSETELEYFTNAFSGVKDSIKTIDPDEFLKANPRARQALLTVEQIRSLVPEAARESYDKAVGKSVNVLDHLKAWGETKKEEGLTTNRGQPAGAAGGGSRPQQSDGPLTLDESINLSVAELVKRQQRTSSRS